MVSLKIILTGIVVAGCTNSPQLIPETTTPTGSGPYADRQILEHRPIQLPNPTAWQDCPTTKSPGKQVSPDFGTALGEGPVYAIGIDDDGGRLIYDDTVAAGADWHPVKVLWVIDPLYSGAVLIRGQQIHGPNTLGFDDPNVHEMFFEQITPGPTWRTRPAETYVRAPGCYSYQIDGFDFSYNIVVKADDLRFWTPTPKP
jgi:hypothetical protein